MKAKPLPMPKFPETYLVREGGGFVEYVALGVVGLLAVGTVAAGLFGTWPPHPIAVGWLVGGLILITGVYVERRR